MSVLDIRPTNEYWDMKKRIQKQNGTKVIGRRHQKDYDALLTITEMPMTKESQDRLVGWLKEKIKEIKTTNPHDYASPCRFRLMK